MVVKLVFLEMHFRHGWEGTINGWCMKIFAMVCHVIFDKNKSKIGK